MSQCDNTLFFVIIRSILFISVLGLGLGWVHVFFAYVSIFKSLYNYYSFILFVCKKLQFCFKTF